MRFTVLGHGALAIEAAGRRILVDPWLSGSCYWRSWWHYPPSAAGDEHLAPDFVYLSHHHFDHFHYPSMRRLDRSATVLVPKFAVDVMPGEVRSLGFDSVRELAHGDVVELAPGLRVASFQYGFDDSALLVEADGVVLADLNDCKVRGRSLDEVRAVFGRPTFLFKSHSWAQAYPVRYTSDDPAQLGFVSREAYVADFLELTRGLQPRYAVPFASMVCFLHPETVDVNDHIVTPREVAGGFAADPVPGTDLVVLAPGDSWSSDGGFSRTDVDWYDPEIRAAKLAELADDARPLVDKALADEAGVRLAWPDFEAFFSSFLAALPPGTGRALLPRPVAFRVESDDATPYWTIDARHRRVFRAAAPPEDVASVITAPEALVADAIAKKVVNLLHISLRLRVELAPGGVDTDLAFWALLAIWELGYLPPWKLRSRRATSTAWRRRRELVEMVTRRLVGTGSLAERMTGGLISAPVPSSAPDAS